MPLENSRSGADRAAKAFAFYHFVSVTAKTPEKIAKAQVYEQNCHLFFKQKWGQIAQHNPTSNSKLLSRK